VHVIIFLRCLFLALLMQRVDNCMPDDQNSPSVIVLWVSWIDEQTAAVFAKQFVVCESYLRY